jgi:hypothetical protein
MNNLIDAIVPIIITIAVISGIINSIRESMAQKSKTPVQPEAARSRAQAEIAAFLSGKPAGGAGAGQKGQVRNSELQAGFGGVVRQNQPAPPAAIGSMNPNRPGQSAGGSSSGGPRPQKSKPPKSKKPKTALSQGDGSNAGGSRAVGSGIREHVDAYIGQHVATHMARNVEGQVKKDIDENVRRHLGTGSLTGVAAEPPKREAMSAASIVEALRQPEGMRQALLMGEILSRPRSLRK